MAKARARHILVATEESCNELKSLIESGTEFAECARLYYPPDADLDADEQANF